MNQHTEPPGHFIASLAPDSRHRKTFGAVSADNDVSLPSGDQKTFWRPGS